MRASVASDRQSAKSNPDFAAKDYLTPKVRAAKCLSASRKNPRLRFES